MAAVARDMGGEKLEVWCAGGMVGDNGLDDAVLGVAVEFGPESILVGLRTDGRAAFVPGVAITDLLGCKGEVVIAGFGCDGNTFGTGLAQEWDGLHGGKMYDVQGELGS